MAIFTIVRNLLYLAIPNAAVFLLHLGLFPLLEKEEIIAERGHISLRGRTLSGWCITQNIADITEVTFKNAEMLPLFRVVFKDAIWHLGLDMPLDERRGIRTELARFLGKQNSLYCEQ